MMPRLFRRGTAAVGPSRLATAGLVAAITAASAVVLITPQRAEACGGTPPPPPSFCGKGYAFAKAGPPVILAAGAAVVVPIPTFHFLTLVESNPAAPVCPGPPYTISGTYTIGPCFPVGPGAGPIPWGPILIAPGVNFVPIPITIPAGPARICFLTITSSITFTDGMVIGPLVGDQQICIVDPAPGDPSTPRLDLQHLLPGSEIVGAHAGDQSSTTYVITNNDPVESWTGVIDADFRNTAKQPGESPAGPVRHAMALADPGDGDDWPIEFDFNLPPGGCIPLPPNPELEILSEIQSDPITLLPGESFEFDVIARSWGMCADGSCGESTVVATGLYTDGSDGIACVGSAYYADNTIPPQYAWPDSGAVTNLFCDDFGPPGAVVLEAFPTPNPTDQYQALFTYQPGQFFSGGNPVPSEAFYDCTGQQFNPPFTGRTTCNLSPFVPVPIDPPMTLEYRVDLSGFNPPPVQIELVQLDLVSASPVTISGEAPFYVGLALVDQDGDTNPDTELEFMFQISAYAFNDLGEVCPVEIFNTNAAFDPAGFNVIVEGQALGCTPGSQLVQLQVMNDIRGYARPLGIAPVGACCWACPDGATCIDGTTFDECKNVFQGLYAGDGTLCSDGVCATICRGDLDGNGTNDVFDFGIFASNFGILFGAMRCQGDLNCDGAVNVFDFGIYSSDFGCFGLPTGTCP